jgi:hypothetical protein
MTTILSKILDVLNLLVCWIKTALIGALNLVIAALGSVIATLAALLPDMPDLPPVPGEVTAAASWVNWIFPVEAVAGFFAFILGAWLVWQGVALVMRWAKALGE